MSSAKIIRKIYIVVLLVGIGILIAFPALAQKDYPTKPVQIVAPFPPGGSADLHARPLAAALEKILKQPVVVVNKSGAGGALGAQTVAVSRPDGYTLLLGLSFLSYYPEVDILFDRTPTFKREQFAPIAMLSKDPAVLITKNPGPWKNIAEFVADAKKRPGEIKYSSAGVYSTVHLAMEMFTHAAHLNLRHIPFPGGNPALMALLGGNVDASCIPPSVAMAQLKGGLVKVLANWADKRISPFADAPTLKESGYDVEFYVWAALLAPKGTPPEVIKILREATRKAVEDPTFRAAMDAIQTPLVYMDADEFQPFWDRDAQKLSEVVRRIGKIQ
ncbi:MAG: Tat pathway signal protein [Deltaproteobacteria bacterium]|nr:Tat pathway signal protein [Deltaproteobacteria bacterium]